MGLASFCVPASQAQHLKHLRLILRSRLRTWKTSGLFLEHLNRDHGNLATSNADRHRFALWSRFLGWSISASFFVPGTELGIPTSQPILQAQNLKYFHVVNGN